MRPEHPRKRSKKRFGRFYDRVSGPKTYFSGKFRASGERRPSLGSSAAGGLLGIGEKCCRRILGSIRPARGTAAGRGLSNGGREGSWLSGLRGIRVQGRRRPAGTPQSPAAARHLVGGSLDDPLGWFGRGRSPTSGRAGRATRAAQPRHPAVLGRRRTPAHKGGARRCSARPRRAARSTIGRSGSASWRS